MNSLTQLLIFLQYFNFEILATYKYNLQDQKKSYIPSKMFFIQIPVKYILLKKNNL